MGPASSGRVAWRCSVVEPGVAATTIGLGARLDTRAPGPVSRTDVRVPLMRVPADKTRVATAIPGTADGRLLIRSEIGFGTAAAKPGAPSLEGVAFGVDVGADGSTPRVTVHLRGLRLTGQDAPEDVDVDPFAGAGLGDEALQMVLGLIERAVAGASGPLAQLLALVGIASDSALPPLRVADVLARGLPAWREWLAAVLASPAAASAWLARAAALAGHGATVSAPGAPDAPRAVTWSVLPGVPLALTVRIRRTPEGAPEVELGGTVRAAASGSPPGGVELDAVLVRITLGPEPALRALPRFDLLARLGADTGPALVDVATPRPVKVQALRAGLALDAARRPVLVLAAHGVRLGTVEHAVLDLTNSQTLADLGGDVVGGVAGAVFGRLGPAEQAVRVLVGLSPPPGRPGWPAALTPVTQLLADPVGATLAYHSRVLRLPPAGAPPAAPYADLVAQLGVLAALPGQPPQVKGSGSDGDPWRVALADGVDLTVVADAAVTLGVALRRSVDRVGGGCARVAFEARADLLARGSTARAARRCPARRRACSWAPRTTPRCAWGPSRHGFSCSSSAPPCAGAPACRCRRSWRRRGWRRRSRARACRSRCRASAATAGSPVWCRGVCSSSSSRAGCAEPRAGRRAHRRPARLASRR